MKTPETLVWTDELATGVPVLDREHAALLALFHDLADPAHAGDRAAVRALLDTLIADVCRHFDHEEQLMHASHFPETGSHEDAHALLLKQINSFVILQDSQPDGWVAAHIVDFVGRWLIDHIRSDDQRFGHHLARHGADD